MAVLVSTTALQAAGRQIGSLPAAANDGLARLVIAEGRLELSVSGPESTLTVIVPVEGNEHSETIVQGAMLTGFLSVVDGDAVELALEADLQLRAASGDIDLPCVPLDSWNSIQHKREVTTEWDAGALEQVARVIHAASTKDVGKAISGVCFVDGKAVATDTYQLAAVDLATGFVEALVVPAEALEVVGRLHNGISALSLCTSDQGVTFRGDSWTFTTKLIMDTFPKWKTFVPEPAAPTLITRRADLLEALRKMRVVAGRAFSNRICIESVGPKQLRVWAQSPDVGRHEERFTGTFGLQQATFDLERLSRAVEQVPADTVALEMAGLKGPAVIRSGGYLASLMPLRR